MYWDKWINYSQITILVLNLVRYYNVIISLSLQDEGGKEKETKKNLLGIHLNPLKFEPNSQIFSFSWTFHFVNFLFSKGWVLGF